MAKIILLLTVLLYALPSISKDDSLIYFIKTHKNENDVANYITNHRLTNDDINTALALWKQEKNRYPDIPWNIVSSDRVKISLADILMQAKRHCLVDISMNEFHDFILSKSRSENLVVKGHANLALGLAGFDSDIPYLSSIILQEEEGWAEEAALSMNFIGSSDSRSKIKELYGHIRRESLKNFLGRIKNQNKKFEHMKQLNNCNP